MTEKCPIFFKAEAGPCHLQQLSHELMWFCIESLQATDCGQSKCGSSALKRLSPQPAASTLLSAQPGMLVQIKQTAPPQLV